MQWELGGVYSHSLWGGGDSDFDSLLESCLDVDHKLTVLFDLSYNAKIHY